MAKEFKIGLSIATTLIIFAGCSSNNIMSKILVNHTEPKTKPNPVQPATIHNMDL